MTHIDGRAFANRKDLSGRVMERAEKEEIISELNQSMSRAQVTVCADARGLTVAQVTQLRKQLRASGAVAQVVKNTLGALAAKKACADAPASDVEKMVALFTGPSFVVFSDKDPVAPVKVLVEYAKKNDKLKLKGAWLDGACLGPAEVDALSKLPGKNETIAKLLALLNTPATQLLRVLQAPSEQMVRLIEARRKQLEEGSAPSA
jgi:large subunit ribosomal protein L10